MKHPRWNDLMPPWSKGNNHAWVCVGSLVVSAFFSVCAFQAALTGALQALHIWEYGYREAINPEATMTSFAGVLEGVFLPFCIAVIAAALLAWVNYSGFSQGSKALYLMRRLPDRWELPRRCLALPLLTLLGAVLCVALLTLTYWGVYCWATPDQCMQPNQWPQVWARLPHILFPFL